MQRGWTLADLDSLPAGVALPLRQAIQHCRSAPPTGWPREAYVLVGRNDIAARMAAAEEEGRPEAAAVTSIVTTPLGRMAKTASPTKRHPLRPAPTPANRTPLVRPLGAMGIAPVGTPPVASASRAPPGSGGGVGGPHGAALEAPTGGTSRVAALPELLPPPYTHRLQLGAEVAGAEGQAEEGQPSAPGGQGGSSAGRVDDGMEHLSQQAARLRFGRDLRLMEVCWAGREAATCLDRRMQQLVLLSPEDCLSLLASLPPLGTSTSFGGGVHSATAHLVSSPTDLHPAIPPRSSQPGAPPAEQRRAGGHAHGGDGGNL